LKWFGIDKQSRTLQVSLSPPSPVRPNSKLTIPVKLGGLNPGEDAKVVVAAVDVGILNLTNYKPPAPDDYYLGQRRLTAEIRDLYGQLIDGMQGTLGAIKSGGDAGGELQGAPPTQKPLALYSGVVTVAADGTASIDFDIGDFAGTARVMAVAWTATKLGRANVDVTVRDPVVLTATLPRFLLSGDHGTMSMDLDNVEGAGGDYTLNVRATGPVKLGGDASTTLKLAASQRSTTTLGLDAAGSGTAQLDVEIKGPNGLALARHYSLDVKPATQILARRSIRTLAKGESLTLTADMFSDLVPGTGAVSLSASLSTALDAATILQALDRYPFGCSEQITSRAMPLLYVNDLAAGAHLAMDTAVDQRIKDAIDRLLARQGSNGSFGLWSAGGDDAWLDAYVTDFLTRAREKGFAVPDVLFKNALDRVRNSVVNADEPEKNGGANLAYGLYVLARNGAAPIGDLRYLADTKLSNLSTSIAKSQLAAALALVGDKARAERVYAAALDSLMPKPTLEFGRVDYGSQLRDAAALVSLASEGNAPRATLSQAVQRVETARGLTPYTSTQENAWLVLASRALSKETMSLDVDGSPVKTALYRTASRSSAITSRLMASRPTSPRRNKTTASRLCSRSPSRNRNSGTSWWPIICQRGSRSTIRIWCPQAIPARWTGSRTARSRRTPSSATIASRLRSIAAPATRRCSPSPMWCARFLPANTCCRRPMSRTCTIPRAMAAPAPELLRCGRPNERNRNHRACRAAPAAVATDQTGRGRHRRRRFDRERRIRGLGGFARAVAAAGGTTGFANGSGPQRQAAAGLCDG
jgi:uncharacterized protein YfaS (alpha-2-macroglobulin family)